MKKAPFDYGAFLLPVLFRSGNCQVMFRTLK